MPQNKSFTFENGLTVELKKISQFMLSRLMVDNTGKFPIPEVVMKFGTRKTEKLVPDYDNAIYKELVTAQKQRDMAETLANISVFSVVDEIPNDEYDYYYGLAEATQGEDFKDSFVKSLWLLNQIDTPEELEKFQEAILGMDTVTERGVEESQKKFPDESE